MRRGVLKSVGVAAVVVAAGVLLNVTPVAVAGQTPTAPAAAARTGAVPKTAWGEPDLQGIWNDENDIPLQRSPKVANQEFFTEEQRKQLDKERGALLSRDKRVERGTELDVAGAYNAVFISVKPTGRRTSLIVDPPNGRLPPTTAEAQKFAAAERDFRLALLQSTNTCKTESVACAGAKYDPKPSPRMKEPPPRYNVGRMNRHDNPEDGSLGDRCMSASLPDFGWGTAGCSAGSSRRRPGSRCSTTRGRAKDGSGIS